MRPDLQSNFIDAVTSETYDRFKRDLDDWLGMQIEYRVCEMPIFVSDALRRTMEEAGRDILLQCTTADAVARTEVTLHDRYRVPNESPKPLFAVTDFAVTMDADGEYQPKLIELQGFPSLLGYQHILGRMYQEKYGLGGSAFMGGHGEAEYLDVVRKAIYAEHDPNDCALVEIDPDRQKTRSDFHALKKYIGLETVNIRDLKIEGGKVFASINGSRRHLKRIFNRAIVDELDDLGVQLPFSWSDDLDVEWAGHPNWYFRISKFSMPYLDHASVPKTTFLHMLTDVPDDLTNYVLKPLYSFAGKGVNVHPTAEDVSNVPEGEREHWILQQKVFYTPCVATPHGENKVEIRVMYVWLDEWTEPKAVMSLARTGRGALMGARYNTDLWTGSSACLFFP